MVARIPRRRLSRRSHLEVRVLLGDHGAIALVDGFRDRDQLQSRFDVAPGLDAPAGDREGDVLATLEIAVGGLRGHLHTDAGRPGDLVCPLPMEVRSLIRLSGPDVHHQVEVGELESLWHVGVAQLRSHLRILAHHREHAVHHLTEFLGRCEWACHLCPREAICEPHRPGGQSGLISSSGSPKTASASPADSSSPSPAASWMIGWVECSSPCDVCSIISASASSKPSDSPPPASSTARRSSRRRCSSSYSSISSIRSGSSMRTTYPDPRG